ncbi:DUF6165 family protein [Rubellimicrobium sp. CFH 75288]|uniref:DUF6165 family protein n=1 Tax=Rubellimicrobium sp. CFH 75288 TaxID=2697034 RepID=UPI0014121AC1|nr:DUF6165 family protein [Rubellimicrobium sp. CFH 75288]NAZ37267.1 hypothetical protein [Rubellimicrobium sp. CFH 75288]
MSDPSAAGTILVPVSAGELFDKISILRLKAARIADPAALANVATELALLEEAAARAIRPDPGLSPLLAELDAVNAALWDIEDAIRERDRTGDFGPAFVALAQSVYRTNDRRAAIKRAINRLTGSALTEEKSYAAHGGTADGP